MPVALLMYFATDMKIFWSIICCFTAVFTTAMAQQAFDFNTNCQKAYEAAMSLKLEEADRFIKAEKSKNPANLIPVYLENYLDFFELFLNENLQTYNKLKPNKKKRLELLENASQQTPLNGFMRAVIELQWAAIEGKFGNKMSAGWGFRDALKTIKENHKRFPDFSPNLMIMGPVQMAAGTIPKGYKWLGALVGISGSLSEGKSQMAAFLKAEDPWAKLFKTEGIFYHCYLQFYLLNEPDEALALIRSRNLDIVNNHLFTFMAANLSLNNKQSAQARQIVLNRNKSDAYMKTTVWDFELAYASLYNLHPDAEIYFNRFLTHFKGQYYVKDAWHKLAFHYLLQGNMPKYNACIQNVLSKGKQDAEADKRAYREAASGKIPDLVLLKARLLSDGGYHREALLAMAGKTTADYTDPNNKLEFVYRLARIYDDLGQHDKAITTYEAAIRLGQNSTQYYAARAAMQIGLIYEAQKKYAEAIRQYQRCIDMKDHDYENSLEQKAKAGINRCKQSR